MDNKHNKVKNSANDLYDIYAFSEKLYEYKDYYKITEGINDVVIYENCFWLLNLILQQQLLPELDCEIQNWELERMGDRIFNLSCLHENGMLIHEIKDLEIEFYFDHLKIIKKGNIFCLPIEKELY